MRHQDPLRPAENKEFIAQLAQFSALEQMMQVSRGSSLAYGVSLIGKWVLGTDAAGMAAAGEVIGMRMSEGMVVLRLADPMGALREMDLAAVREVAGP